MCCVSRNSCSIRAQRSGIDPRPTWACVLWLSNRFCSIRFSGELATLYHGTVDFGEEPRNAFFRLSSVWLRPSPQRGERRAGGYVVAAFQSRGPRRSLVCVDSVHSVFGDHIKETGVVSIRPDVSLVYLMQ